VSEAWYYADYNGRVGPTTLQELKNTLARSSEPENVLVWRHGFTEWVRAGDAPELRSQPPELPTDQMPWWWYPIPFISLGKDLMTENENRRPHLRTKCIFVDTQALRKARFDWNGRSLSCRVCEAGAATPLSH
jgi:hypothetical protein